MTNLLPYQQEQLETIERLKKFASNRPATSVSIMERVEMLMQIKIPLLPKILQDHIKYKQSLLFRNTITVGAKPMRYNKSAFDHATRAAFVEYCNIIDELPMSRDECRKYPISDAIRDRLTAAEAAESPAAQQ